jgi:acyl-CoA thioesterase-1
VARRPNLFNRGLFDRGAASRGQVSRRHLLAGAGAALFLCLFGFPAATGTFAAETTPRILILGDSLTAGYGLPREQGFNARLAAALAAAGRPVSLIEASVSGDTSAAARARLDWSLNGSTPDAAIVELGANDALRGMPPEQMRANLTAILDALKARGIPVLLAGMHAPRNLGDAYDREFDAVFDDLAKKYGVVFYPFFLDGVVLDPALNQADGIHPNADGVDVIVKRILPSVEELLNRAANRRAG